VDVPSDSSVDPRRDVVVLLHGWWSGPWELWRVEASLKQAGYRVLNLRYPSVRVPLEELAARELPQRLHDRLPPDARQVHFVTHSMGGLLVREYLRQRVPGAPTIGRIVMVGPPNHGSELADGLPGGVIRWLAGPNSDRLRTGADALPQRLPSAAEMPGEVGIIAGSFSWWPNRKLPYPHDGRVSVASAWLPGARDLSVVAASHTWLPWDRRVLRQIQAFLATGRFLGNLAEGSDPGGVA
jgi:pimeloyl-ACP methyl ester carboxylesterase